MHSTLIRLAAIQFAFASCFFLDCAARAQSKADEAAVRNIPRAFAFCVGEA